MGTILNLFTPKVGFWAAVVLLLLNIFTIGAEELRLWDVREELKTERTLHDACKLAKQTLSDNQDRLEASLADQGAKIKAMQAEAARRATLAAAAAKAGLAATKKRQDEASRLGSGPDIMNAWQKGLFQ